MRKCGVRRGVVKCVEGVGGIIRGGKIIRGTEESGEGNEDEEDKNGSTVAAMNK